MPEHPGIVVHVSADSIGTDFHFDTGTGRHALTPGDTLSIKPGSIEMALDMGHVKPEIRELLMGGTITTTSQPRKVDIDRWTYEDPSVIGGFSEAYRVTFGVGYHDLPKALRDYVSRSYGIQTEHAHHGHKQVFIVHRAQQAQVEEMFRLLTGEPSYTERKYAQGGFITSDRNDLRSARTGPEHILTAQQVRTLGQGYLDGMRKLSDGFKRMGETMRGLGFALGGTALEPKSPIREVSPTTRPLTWPTAVAWSRLEGHRVIREPKPVRNVIREI